MKKILEDKSIAFIEESLENSSKTFIKSKKNIELYYLSANDNESYYSKHKQIKIENSNSKKVEPKTHIIRKDEKKYLPFKKRTKTLQDLKNTIQLQTANVPHLR